MKAIIILFLIFIANFGLSAQDFKKLIPNKEPFKVFETPKFPTIISNDESLNERKNNELQYAELDNMPILKYKLYIDKLPILKADNTVKYTLLTIDPTKKVGILPEKK